ncbi:WD and tetratricopeptide repeats protein [Saguinus oedipus]|uniref:WD and tetratricopeptide repeats protein n=1 Tax=Saguinus oedipus TaxID=9490 RepID=A0ABQ9VA67_SAGOE|nr:WD and tetratricopeptide repeats protein [Saguinus oedipus]
MAKVNITRDLIHRQIKERGALSFERRYHVTDPFIRRLGLEAELQVRGPVYTLDAHGLLCILCLQKSS